MVLTVENLSKSYGEKILFDNVNFSIDQGDKVGIVGVNGTGKSTFMATLAGKIVPDRGEFITAKKTVVEYLPQDKVFNLDNTVLQEVFQGEQEIMKVLYEYELAVEEAEANPKDLNLQNKLARLSARIDELNGWQMEAQAKTVLNKLGITKLQVPVRQLSGGQQKRLALATALIHPCDLLLLDEPTNHLDSETIIWLEKYLQGLKTALIMVTHDRYFLDAVATKILELDRGASYVYTGNYTEFLRLKSERIAREAASENKRQNFLRNELKWVQRGALARSTKQRARLERYEEVKNQKYTERNDKIEIGLAGSRLGRTIIELENVSYEIDGRTIIKDFTYTLLKGDRIGILGTNGTGKTTLLNTFAGELQPTEGTVVIGQTVKIGYFKQTNVELDESIKAIEYIKEIANYLKLADGTLISASQLMERFLFPKDLQWAPIGKLSGGEKRRLYLLGILMESPNVLLLDEPTNDLDLETMSVLEDFMDSFNGAILFVSHDRFFVDRIADKAFVYEPGGHIRQIMGGYSYYQGVMEKEEAEVKETAAVKEKHQPEPPKEKLVKESVKKLTFKEQREYEEIEDLIAETEGKLKVIQQQMVLYSTDFVELKRLSDEEAETKERLDYLMDRWAYLEDIVQQSGN